MTDSRLMRIRIKPPPATIREHPTPAHLAARIVRAGARSAFLEHRLGPSHSYTSNTSPRVGSDHASQNGVCFRRERMRFTRVVLALVAAVSFLAFGSQPTV